MSLTQQGQSTFMNALLIPGIFKAIGYSIMLIIIIEDNTNEDGGYQQQQSKKRSLDSAEVADKESPTPKKERKPRKAPHELLTDAEKKANHIASEKKRRQNIRLGFDQLIEIVPSLTQGNRSEAFILQKCIHKAYIYFKSNNNIFI